PSPVRTLIAVTITPGSTPPLASWTLPRSSAVDWPKTCAGTRTTIVNKSERKAMSRESDRVMHMATSIDTAGCRGANQITSFTGQVKEDARVAKLSLQFADTASAAW